MAYGSKIEYVNWKQTRSFSGERSYNLKHNCWNYIFIVGYNSGQVDKIVEEARTKRVSVASKYLEREKTE